MKLNNITTWISIVRVYYIAVIHQEVIDNSYTNEAELITTLDSYLDNFETEYQRYLSSSEILINTKRSLINSYSYINSAYVNVNTDPNYPTSEFSLGVDGFKSLYSLFTYDLPADPTAYFTIEDPELDGTAVLNDESSFPDLIDSLIQADVANLKLMQESAIPSANQILYSMYGNPPVSMKVYPLVNIKDVLLTDLKFQECLDAFGWEIIGINL